MKTLTARSYIWKIMLTIFSGRTQSAVVPEVEPKKKQHDQFKQLCKIH